MARLANVRIVGVILGVLCAGLLGSWFLSASRESLTTWLPLGLSISSLAISIMSAFKAELFDFAPGAIGGDFALIHSSEPNYSNSAVLLPLHFVNSGYGDGAILSFALKAKNHNRNETYLLIPVVEVDLAKLIQNTGRMHATNVIGPVLGFPLSSKQVVSKSIAFVWVADNPKYASPNLEPGKYSFDLYLETTHRGAPRLVLTIEHTFDQEQIESFKRGGAIYNMRTSPLTM